MIRQNNDFTSVLKSTSLFGAVQIYNILISVIRSKVIALWIGPTGMGIIGLLASTLKVIGEFTRLGLSTTAVREIALANREDDEFKTIETVATIKKVVWVTGLFGVLAVMICSPWLSYLAFDNYDYTLAFFWISISLLFNQLSDGQLALLQGFRKLKLLAKTNLIGNFLALLISLPLYYFFRLDAIVPVIIASSLIALMVSWFYSKKLHIQTLKISNRQAFTKAKVMLKLGFMLSLSSSLTLVSAYVFQIYLSNVSGVAEVGYYLAGFMVLNSYVGMVFKAMQTDYFPKLSGVVQSIEAVNKTVSEQAIIALLIMGPLIVGFMACLPIIIKLLYSEAFLVIVKFMSWAILGMLFKTLSWSMGYVILAKGDSKVFIKTAVFFNSLLLAFNILGYHYYGLEGLGMSFLAYYFLHFVGIRWITHKRYKLQLESSLTNIFLILLICAGLSFSITFIDTMIYRIILFTVIIIITSGYSYSQLDRRVGFVELLNQFLKKTQ